MCQPMEKKTSSTCGSSPTCTKEAKEAFHRVLLENKGDASHDQVQSALEDLIRLAAEERRSCSSRPTNATCNDGTTGSTCTCTRGECEREQQEEQNWSPTSSAEANRGRWILATAPSFPGRLADDACTDDDAASNNVDNARARYTLGKMAFGMFKPSGVVCEVEQIINVVDEDASVIANASGNASANANAKNDDPASWTQTYSIEALVNIETPNHKIGKMPARLINYGICFPTSSTRLGVKFTKGTLQPRFNLDNEDNNDNTKSKVNADLASAWKDTFGNAISKERQEQSYLGRLGTWLVHKLMYLVMGLEPPVDVADYTQTYTISRPITGYLDVLYLDDDYRITRGNKGTICVVQKEGAEG